MSKETLNKIAIFEDSEIRKEVINGEWVFSIIDVISTLIDNTRPRKYWSDLKTKIISEGSIQLSEKIGQLKLKSSDGKSYLTDVANTETMFRIIQSIPSSKVEPFKLWLARIGKERLDEIEQPSKAIERAKGYYIAKGRTPEWIQTRTASIETRHTFTDKLKDAGIEEPMHYAILTDELYKSSFGFTSSEYRHHKKLVKGDSLRDNMTPLELAATIFSEATSTEIITETGAKDFVETKKAIHIAGNITKEAIEKIEKQTGKKVVTYKNAKELDTPEIRKELAQQTSSKEKIDTHPIEKLSSFNDGLNVLLNTKPPQKDKTEEE